MKPLKEKKEKFLKENLLPRIMSSMMFDDCFQVFFFSTCLHEALFLFSPHCDTNMLKREAETLPVPNLLAHPIAYAHVAVFFLTPFIVRVRARQLKINFFNLIGASEKCRR